MRELIERAGGRDAIPQTLYRKNDAARQNALMDPYSLQAWCLHVLATAREHPLQATYREGAIDSKFLRFLATLSRLPDGPKRAVEALEQQGVAVVYAKHLRKPTWTGQPCAQRKAYQ
jgi:HTH-type transcriptional regulator/antitoxin HigA